MHAMAALEQRQEEAPVVVDTDRLSSLPEGILVDILSFLPTQAAVSTSVLSTRWRSLWPHVNSLHLHQSHGQNTDDFYALADQLLLTRLTPPILRTFSVHAGDSRPLHFERWLSYLCDHRVEDIDIACGRSSTQPPFTLPLRIFRTRSLVRLLLHPFVRYELPHNDDVVFELPHLKKLLLAFLPSRWSFVSKLIRSCPSLEDLSLAAPWPMSDYNIHYAYGLIMDISCATLKGLELDLCFYDNVEVVIDAPELVWLGLSGGETATYSFVNQRPSLICATILLPSIPLSLYDMIKNVTLLEIHETSFEMLESLEVATGDFSFFPNLTKLHLRFDWVNSSLYDYPFECTSPRLLIHVKEIKVKTSQVYRANKLVEYLLNNAPVMESLIFDVTGDIPLQSEHRIMLEEMMACMRLYSYLSSVNALRCVITFNGRCSKLPLNISEFEELESRVEELR